MNKAVYFDQSRKDDWAFKEYTREEHQKLDHFLDATGISKGYKVLEPGCGTGRFTRKLSARVGPEGQVVAVDISTGMIEECRKRARNLENVKILHMPVEEINFSQGYFDAIFCLCVFPHFEDKSSILGIFHKMLSPSGSVTLAHLEGSRILNKMHHEVGGAVKGDRILPFQKMKRLFHETGFRIDHFQDEDDGYLLVARLHD